MKHYLRKTVKPWNIGKNRHSMFLRYCHIREMSAIHGHLKKARLVVINLISSQQSNSWHMYYIGTAIELTNKSLEVKIRGADIVWQYCWLQQCVSRTEPEWFMILTSAMRQPHRARVIYDPDSSSDAKRIKGDVLMRWKNVSMSTRLLPCQQFCWAVSWACKTLSNLSQDVCSGSDANRVQWEGTLGN